MSVSLWGNGQTILQVVNAVTTTQTSTSSASFVAATSLSASITPFATTSKILIIASVYIDTLAASQEMGLTIYKNGSTNLGTAGSGFGYNYASGARIQSNPTISFLDSPATTSSTTYQVYFLSANTGTVAINYTTGQSTITLLEISGA